MPTLFDNCTESMPTSKERRLLPSYSFDQREILRSIIELHCPDGIDIDAAYGNGGFYSPIEQPRIAFDVDPQKQGVIKASSARLPLASCSSRTIMFDPPFITYISGARDHNSIMSRRFGGYYTYEDLESHYRKSLGEFSRVLRHKGVLVFKCQDVIHNHRLFPTHVNVANWAAEAGFRARDMFVLIAENRMPGPQKGKQRHARIHQSFFWVFQKS